MSDFVELLEISSPTQRKIKVNAINEEMLIKHNKRGWIGKYDLSSDGDNYNVYTLKNKED